MPIEKHQDIGYDSSNNCVRSFNKLFCFWGQRKKPYNVNGNIKGKTAPLWENPAKKFFMWMFIISLIMSILFIAAYIVVNYYNNDIEDSINDKTNLTNNDNCILISKKKFKTVFVVFGTIILFLNCIIYYFNFFRFLLFIFLL